MVSTCAAQAVGRLSIRRAHLSAGDEALKTWRAAVRWPTFAYLTGT